MNLEVFKLPDPSGRMSKENYLINNYKEEYEYIIQYCIDNNIVDVSFKEKVYLAVNNYKKIPKCKNNDCFNSVKLQNSTLGYRDYCSNKCISSDLIIKKIKEDKSFERFGTKSPAQSKQIKDKIIKTNNMRYGGNSAMSSIDIQNKSKETLIRNWGVSNPSQSSILIEKRVESFKENIEQYKDNYKQTSLERYGVEHPWMNKDIHKKTMVFFYSEYRKRIEDILSTYNKYEFVDFIANPNSLCISCKDCNTNFEILPYQFYYRSKYLNKLCTNCYPISDCASLMEVELRNFIEENYKGEIICNSKSIINPYEIDIYLPALNIGFEFNGVYWHSELYKQKNYHYDKYKMSNERGIKLITIWEDDWIMKSDIVKSFIMKSDIVKSFILNKLNNTKNRIYARKCIIKEIDYKQSMKFLNENHLQGDIKSPIRIGLFYEDKLVSLMTFSHLRAVLAHKNNDSSIYELTRFVNILNTNVIGGHLSYLAILLRHIIHHK